MDNLVWREGEGAQIFVRTNFDERCVATNTVTTENE